MQIHLQPKGRAYVEVLFTALVVRAFRKQIGDHLKMALDGHQRRKKYK